MVKTQRLRERGEESKKEMGQGMAFRSIKDIEEALDDSGKVSEPSHQNKDENLNVVDDFFVEDKKIK